MFDGNLIAFVVLVAAVAVAARMIFPPSAHAADQPMPSYPEDPSADVYSRPVAPTVAPTGAELPFPIALPELQQRPDGGFNRPEVLNYYFSKIDLVRGPEDPKSFCDDFFLELQHPGDTRVWTLQYTVATPAGLQAVMDTGHFSSLYFDNKVVVVTGWDMANLLQTLLDEIIKDYMADPQ